MNGALWPEDYLAAIAGEMAGAPMQGVLPGGAGPGLANVYTPPLSGRTQADEEALVLRRARAGDLAPGSGRYLSPLELLDRAPRLLLLGEAGSGKTTFLRYLSLCLAGEALGLEDANLKTLTAPVPGEDKPQPWGGGRLIPVYVNLAEKAEQGAVPGSWRALLAWLLEARPGRLAAEVEAGRAILLLDGLDEMSPGARPALLRALAAGRLAAPDARIVLTARPGMAQGASGAGLKEVALQGVNRAQIAATLSAWAAAAAREGMAPETAGARIEALGVAIDQDTRLAALAGLPFALAWLAALALAGRPAPATRAALLAAGLDVLAEHAHGGPKAINHWQHWATDSIASGRPAGPPPVPVLEHAIWRDYLAAGDLAREGLSGRVAEDPERWQSVALAAGMCAESPADAVRLAAEFCPLEEPNEAREAKQALLAAQVLCENIPCDSSTGAAGQFPVVGSLRVEVALTAGDSIVPPLLRDRLRRYLGAVVARGLLPPVERPRAGELLALLGDSRDLDQLVEVPAGPFVMGEGDTGNTSPPHVVDLPDFKIGLYPVTNRQYLRFVEATGRSWASLDGRAPARANWPATIVTWHDARAYCAWLTGDLRDRGVIGSDDTARLPTEAEWEKAARGGCEMRHEPGQAGPNARTYPWGDEWREGCANSAELGLGDTCAVGLFTDGMSPYGCLDMAGQVWEWTSSLWGPDLTHVKYSYPYSALDGREDATAPDEVRRILRGGSFAGDRSRARCSFRGGLEPLGFWKGDGFRIVVAQRAATS